MVRGLRGVASEFFGHVATKPHEAEGEDGADLLEVGWVVLQRGERGEHVCVITSDWQKNNENNRFAK